MCTELPAQLEQGLPRVGSAGGSGRCPSGGGGGGGDTSGCTWCCQQAWVALHAPSTTLPAGRTRASKLPGSRAAPPAPQTAAAHLCACLTARCQCRGDVRLRSRRVGLPVQARPCWDRPSRHPNACMSQTNPPVRARMLSHAAQVRALRACGLRKGPRPRAAAALPRCQQRHPDIQQLLLTEQQIAARVKEVGRCAGAGSGPQPCPPGAARRCTGQRPAAQRVGSAGWADGCGMHVAQPLATAAAHARPPCSPHRQIAVDYAGRRPLIVGTLKGAVVFLSDLVRAIEPLPPGLQVGPHARVGVGVGGREAWGLECHPCAAPTTHAGSVAGSAR